MSKNSQKLGKTGEETAIIFLKDNGYKILASNYRTKLGEVDIIAKDKDVICFIEVKTRHSNRFGLPKEALSGRKQRQIAKSALVYLKENKLLENKSRFDVVSLLCGQGRAEIELIKNAFELDASFTY